MSVIAENTGDAPAARDSKRAEETVHEVLLYLIEEKIKANLEPFYEQISTLTQLLNQLIQENRGVIRQRGSPYSADTAKKFAL